MLVCGTEHRATRPVFGQSLELHLIQTGREISIVIEGCINILHQDALDEEVASLICLMKIEEVASLIGTGCIPVMESHRI